MAKSPGPPCSVQVGTAEGFAVVGQAADGDPGGRDGDRPATAWVLMLTAVGHPATLVDRAQDAGAMAYVRKQCTTANLLPAIEMSIARYADTTALRAKVADMTQRLHARKVIDRAKLAAAAVANAEAQQELHELADTQAALRRLAMLVARGEPPEAVFAAATREALRHFGS